MENIEELSGAIAQLDNLLTRLGPRFVEGVEIERYEKIVRMVRSLKVSEDAGLEVLEALEPTVWGLSKAFDYGLFGRLSGKEYEDLNEKLDRIVVFLNRATSRPVSWRA